MRSALLLLILPAVLILLIILRITLASRRQKMNRPNAPIVGITGIAETDLNDEGLVLIANEVWRAKALTAIPRGARVRVTAIDGVLLRVERM